MISFSNFDKSESDTIRFDVENCNSSFVNAIRRTILSDIPVLVFKTTPYEENKVNIIKNTSRFNNEIIKQRMGCIPIHISDLTIPYEKFKRSWRNLYFLKGCLRLSYFLNISLRDPEKKKFFLKSCLWIQ